MKKIAKSLTELIGNTPLLELVNYNKTEKIHATILAKIESFNPLSSIKDRVGFALLLDGEEKGLIHSNTTIIEPTSGNTGIGLAFACASRNYRLILTMPETMSMERKSLLKALGAELVLTEGKKGMQGAIEKATQLKEEIKDSVILGQFTNPANREIHKKTTAKEIYEDCEGKVDILVAGVGTGGTISGIGEYLKSKNPTIQVIAVEPYDSPFLTMGKAGPHGLQGIGAGFIPSILNQQVIDEIILVKTDEAYHSARLVAKREGLLVGISSGAALHAATIVAKREENKGKNIVVILPDSGERYLSTDLFK